MHTWDLLYLTEIKPLQELGSNFAEVLNGVTKVQEILSIPTYEENQESIKKFPEKCDIEISDVTFSYDGKINVLEHCNLKIKDGERIALVGRSGAGKSTIIELISRFYDVTSGCIKSVEKI